MLLKNVMLDRIAGSVHALKLPWLRILAFIVASILTLNLLLSIAPSFLVLNSTSSSARISGNEQGLIPDSWKFQDHGKCLSRFQYQFYRRHASRAAPSDSLIGRLREYEELHARCSSSTESRNSSDCQFVVAVGYMGLGNKMISLVATFAYALLTNRVLLISTYENMDVLFCEPFPRSSWLLPLSKMERLYSLNDSSRLGRVLGAAGSRCVNSTVRYPEDLLVRITHEYDRDDTKFFCEEQQDAIRSQVPWVFIRSNVFYVPSLYYVPSFRREMDRWFPAQDAIFYHLGRYLLHPSNFVWRKTTRFYNSYLAHAETVVGIQMRTHPGFEGFRKSYAQEVLRCAIENRVLPNITRDENKIEAAPPFALDQSPVPPMSMTNISNSTSFGRSIAILVTSLNQNHVDSLRDAYLSSVVEEDVRVSVHQPSHEVFQKTGETVHDEKALMEIYLLSLCDALITSPLSTFGYTAQALAHIRPWLMWIVPDSKKSVCTRDFASDPCFLNFEPFSCDCSQNDTTLASRIQGCEEHNKKWVKLRPLRGKV